MMQSASNSTRLVVMMKKRAHTQRMYASVKYLVKESAQKKVTTKNKPNRTKLNETKDRLPMHAIAVTSILYIRSIYKRERKNEHKTFALQIFNAMITFFAKEITSNI